MSSESSDASTHPQDAVKFKKNDPNSGQNRSDSNSGVYLAPNTIEVKIGLISRRSRHRAGTRYKKRGTDAIGHCANYVETEQILFWPPHWCSYVIVRGSVPLYWSQSGIQYRPPPKLEKSSSYFPPFCSKISF